jgi:hypothetical protein
MPSRNAFSGIVILLSLVSVVSICLNIFQYHHDKKEAVVAEITPPAVSRTLTEAYVDPDRKPSPEGTTAAHKGTPPSELENLGYQLDAAEEELDMALKDLANNRGFDIQDVIAMEKEIKENPTLMNMRRRDGEHFLNQTHGALFERLGLPDEKLHALKALLVDFQMQKNDMSIRLDDQYLPKEKKKEIWQQLEDQRNEFERQAKDLLGAENYEAYVAYDESLSERFIVDGPVNSLSADLGLSDEKERELIDAMYEARKKVDTEYNTDSSDGPSGSVSQDSEKLKDRMIERFDGYIESAKRVLSESQAEEFETRMNEQKEMIKMNRVTFIVDGRDNGPQ